MSPSGVLAANQTLSREILREENQTKTHNCTWDDDGPAPEPVDTASNAFTAPLPSAQQEFQQVHENSLLASTEDATSRTESCKYPIFLSDPNVDLAFRITIVLVFCGLLSLVVFCVYCYCRSRSSRIGPVSFALRNRADM